MKNQFVTPHWSDNVIAVARSKDTTITTPVPNKPRSLLDLLISLLVH